MTIIDNRRIKQLLMQFYNELDDIPKTSSVADEPEIKASDITIHQMIIKDDGTIWADLSHIHKPRHHYVVNHNKKTHVTTIDIYKNKRSVTIKKGRLTNG